MRFQQLNRSFGFTLIELMIVIAIVAILAAVALPSYQNSVKKGHRKAAQSDLMGFAQAMEKEYATKFTYANAAAGTTYSDKSPRGGDSTQYNLSIQAADGNSFRLRATPVGGQAKDGLLEIDHLGQKFWDKNNNGDPNDPSENSWD